MFSDWNMDSRINDLRVLWCNKLSRDVVIQAYKQKVMLL